MKQIIILKGIKFTNRNHNKSTSYVTRVCISSQTITDYNLQFSIFIIIITELCSLRIHLLLVLINTTVKQKSGTKFTQIFHIEKIIADL